MSALEARAVNTLEVIISLFLSLLRFYATMCLCLSVIFCQKVYDEIKGFPVFRYLLRVVQGIHSFFKVLKADMPIDGRELIEAIGVIANEHNVRVTVKQSAKGAAVCAATAFVGGVLLGPVGLAIGGTAGGLVAYKITSGTYRPLADVLINDLNDDQRERLVNHVRNAVAEIEIADVAMLLPLILNNANVQQAVLKTAITFVTNELRMQIID